MSVPSKWRWFRRFSLRASLLIVALFCMGASLRQESYEVESTYKLYKGRGPDRRTIFAEGRRVETFRRQEHGDPLKHGPTREYSDDGKMLLLTEWKDGIRHGAYKKWSVRSSDMVVDMAFDKGRLSRVGNTVIDDFARSTFEDSKTAASVLEELPTLTLFQYREEKLKDIVDDISFRHDLMICLDPHALAKAGFTPDSKVTSDIKGVPLFAALRSVLGELELTCEYRYGLLWITVPESELVTRDVLTGVSDSALAKALDKEASLVYFDPTPIKTVLDDVSTQYHIPIVNKATTKDTAVRLSFRGIPLRSALAAMFHLYGLEGEARDNSLVVRNRPG